MSWHVAEQVCNAKSLHRDLQFEVFFFFLLCSQSPESARIRVQSSKQGKVTRLKAIYLLKVRRHCQRTQSEIKQSRRKAAGKIPRQVGWGPTCWLRPGRFQLRGTGLLWGSLSLSLHSLPLCLACSLPLPSLWDACVCLCVYVSLFPPSPPTPVPLGRKNANHFPLNLLLTLDTVIFNSCTGSVAPIVDISC